MSDEGSEGKHINNFIRINVTFKDSTGFPLLVDRDSAVAYVARQIEAEVSFRAYLAHELNQVTPPDSVAKAIEVYHLLDSTQLALPFEAKVGDILRFDDDVLPITSYDGGGL